jgi:hypothetical protein
MEIKRGHDWVAVRCTQEGCDFHYLSNYGFSLEGKHRAEASVLRAYEGHVHGVQRRHRILYPQG